MSKDIDQDEGSPLVAIPPSPSTASYFQGCSRRMIQSSVGAGIVMAIVLFGGMTLLSQHVFNRQTSSPHDKEILQKEEEDYSLDEDAIQDFRRRPLYRPTCQLHDSTRRVQILQTSLGEPSQPWTPLQECQMHFHKKQTFRAPHAQIRLQLGTLAQSPQRPPILGFGGAFTEASALNFASLSQKGQDRVLELLFGASGLGYSLGRVHMNSCDFSVKSYSFDDTDGDFDLENFDVSVSHDVQSGMVKMMLQAVSVYSKANEGKDSSLKIFASPWSPPAWMKAPTPSDLANNVNLTHATGMTGSAQPVCLRDGVSPDSRYAAAWALYFSKFITAYKELGIPLFAITVQNEPEFPAPWEACSFTPQTQGDFVANHLGPRLRKEHPDVQLFVFDHNKDHAPVWVNTLLDPQNAASTFIDGTAIHWYAGGMDRLLDGAQGTPNVHRVMDDLKTLGVNPNHIIFGSEACHCPTTGYAGGDINVAWARAERYAHTILADLAAGSNGWVEWNLLLDSIGGPNHLRNLCDSPLLAVPHRARKTGNETLPPPTLPFEKAGHPFGRVVGDDRTREELNALGFLADYLDDGVVVQPLYYFMGHISRHVRPGSRAVMALVDAPSGAQIFRPTGGVAGGGINDLARDGIEMTLWPCEGSTRQQFRYTEKRQLLLPGHDWLGNPTVTCVGNEVNRDFSSIMTQSCDPKWEQFGQFEFVKQDNDKNITTIVLVNGKEAGKCLVVEELRNGGGAYGPRGGAQVSLGECNGTKAEWTWREETGEIVSSFFEGGDVCMTTGWPFLQVGAFDTTNDDERSNSRTIVILNEAGQSANYALSDGDDLLASGSIPPHSIQTILVD